MIFWGKKGKKSGAEKRKGVQSAKTSDIKSVSAEANAESKKPGPAIKRYVVSKSADVLKAPRLTEKAATQSERGVYMFEVLLQATKRQIAQAVSEQYGVAPARIRTARTTGKAVSRRGVKNGKRPERKIAYVYLKKGDAISITQ